jgi:hypothetical protein
MFIAVVLCVLSGGTALASGFWYNYDLTIPKFGGTAITNNETKQSQRENAVLCSRAIGNNYTQSARLESLSNGVWDDWKGFSSGDRLEFWYPEPAPGEKFHLRIGNNWTTTVDVQTIGKWSPDNPGRCSG